MVDKENIVYTAVAKAVRRVFPEITTNSEYNRTPSKFPAMTLDESENVVIDRLEDNSHVEKFAGVQYRLRVFSNLEQGKKQEAKKIFDVADSVMREMGFRRATYTTTPDIYSASVYQITATYLAILSEDNYVYRRT